MYSGCNRSMISCSTQSPKISNMCSAMLKESNGCWKHLRRGKNHTEPTDWWQQNLPDVCLSLAFFKPLHLWQSLAYPSISIPEIDLERHSSFTPSLNSEIKVRGKYSVNLVFRGLADLYSNISLISLSSSSFDTVVMFTIPQVFQCFSLCVEGFLFGNIFFYVTLAVSC